VPWWDNASGSTISIHTETAAFIAEPALATIDLETPVRAPECPFIVLVAGAVTVEVEAIAPAVFTRGTTVKTLTARITAKFFIRYFGTFFCKTSTAAVEAEYVCTPRTTSTTRKTVATGVSVVVGIRLLPIWALSHCPRRRGDENTCKLSLTQNDVVVVWLRTFSTDVHPHREKVADIEGEQPGRIDVFCAIINFT
jgi:hypothetical protein